MLTFMLALKLFGFLMCSSVIAIGIPFVLAQFDFKPHRVEYFGEIENTPTEYLDERPTKSIIVDLDKYEYGVMYDRDNLTEEVKQYKYEKLTFWKVPDNSRKGFHIEHNDPLNFNDDMMSYKVRAAEHYWRSKKIDDEFTIDLPVVKTVMVTKPAPPSTGNPLLDKLPRKK